MTGHLPAGGKGDADASLFCGCSLFCGHPYVRRIRSGSATPRKHPPGHPAVEPGGRPCYPFRHNDPRRLSHGAAGPGREETGRLADGVWNEVGASLAIQVTPPFWKRPWFMVLAAAAVGLAAFGLHRYRLNRLLEIERLRTRISADLHDEIATNLSSIAMFSGMIQERRIGDEPSLLLLERLRLLARRRGRRGRLRPLQVPGGGQGPARAPHLTRLRVRIEPPEDGGPAPRWKAVRE